MMSDAIADMVTRIRNAYAVGHETVDVPSSRVIQGIAEILKREGYLTEVERRGRSLSQRRLELKLKYVEGIPAVHTIRRLSKPGQRMYRSTRGIPRVLGGHGCVILSTSQGLMTGKEARQKKTGGEMLVEVW